MIVLANTLFYSLLPDFHFLHFFHYYQIFTMYLQLHASGHTLGVVQATCKQRFNDCVRKLQKLYIIYVIFSISENLQPLSLAGLVKTTENIIQPIANSIKSQLEESTNDLGMEGTMDLFGRN